MPRRLAALASLLSVLLLIVAPANALAMTHNTPTASSIMTHDGFTDQPDMTHN